ncbi:unnamed protein product [Gongylonema pulchrum]|uniref:Uncharacterized protein n=1 Tax=Gongylonema pulchrum TaxID=637853 RepID=A0A183CUP2_9BILA|nr:unnamed protein product [Gongylonema pulchrum]
MYWTRPFQNTVRDTASHYPTVRDLQENKISEVRKDDLSGLSHLKILLVAFLSASKRSFIR